MKLPSCSVCMNTYNELERVPLMLTCGHSFCKTCLAKLFEKCSDNTIICPRCRVPSRVGNSVEALRKNYGMLSLIHQVVQDALADESDSEEERSDVISNTYSLSDRSRGTTPLASPSWPPACTGQSLELSLHHLRLLKQIGVGSRSGNDVWAGVLTAPGGCKHKVAVKRVEIVDETDLGWIQVRMEGLKRASMWCQNVCAIHGLVVRDGKLCVVMDKCSLSLQEAMRLNGGRLTLEQILRFGADIARGMSELHAAGVMAMALKPSNILIDRKGRAVVGDYGLPEILKKPNCRRARQIGSEEVHLDSHSCRECLGLSANYIAPEAWEPLKKPPLTLFWEDQMGLCLESDVWSFGCTLVEMCTGVVPWAGVNMEEIRKHVVKARRQPPQYSGVVGGGVPHELWKTIGDCLQWRPSRRPSFHSMLSLFLRHLREMPLSPLESPFTEVSKESIPGSTESPSPSLLEFVATDEMALHRTVAMDDMAGTKDVLAHIRSEPSPQDGAHLKALLEAKNEDGRTPIHVAAMRGFTDILGLLLSTPEADVEVPDKHGNPPLLYAVAAGAIDCLRQLLKRGAEVNFRLRDGLGPSLAHVCASYGEKECLDELLKAGADPNSVDPEGDTILHKAMAKNFSDCALQVLSRGGVASMAVLNSRGLTPLHMAVSSGAVEVVQSWAEISSQEQIKEAIDIRAPSGTSLCLAASLPKSLQKEARALVSLLLSSGTDFTAESVPEGFTCLHWAAFRDDTEMMKSILSYGVDKNLLDSQRRTPLHVALAKGSNQAVELLLQLGSDCTIQDGCGNTPVHVAAMTCEDVGSNLKWLQKMLQSENFNPHVENNSGKTVSGLVDSLPRELLSEEFLEVSMKSGISLSPTILSPGDWVALKSSLKTPLHGWQNVTPGSIGLVRSSGEDGCLELSICSSEVKFMVEEVVKILGFEQGHRVKVKPEIKQPRYGWRGQSLDSEGTVLCVDEDGLLRVGFRNLTRGWKADPRDITRVVGHRVGDWVQVRQGSRISHGEEGLLDVPHGSIGVVQSIRANLGLLVAFNFLAKPQQCEPEMLDFVGEFEVGSKLCIKRSVSEPRYGWQRETHHSVGTVCQVSCSGLLLVTVGTRPEPWKVDPADALKLEEIQVGDWVRVRTGVPAPKYGWEDVARGSVGVVYCIDEEGDVGVGFGFRVKPFECSLADVEKVPGVSVGQSVRLLPSVVEPQLGVCPDGSSRGGKVVSIDMDGTLNIQVSPQIPIWRVSPGDVEAIPGFKVGDWVRLKDPLNSREKDKWVPSPNNRLAVVHSVAENGTLQLVGSFRKGRWDCPFSEVEKVNPLKVGQLVRVKGNVEEPVFGWGNETPGSTGLVVAVHADGEVRVAIPGASGTPWKVDPGDLEALEDFEVGDWVSVRRDLEGEPTFGWNGVERGSVGVVQGWQYDVPSPPEASVKLHSRVVTVGFCGRQEPWLGVATELERFEAIKAGQRIRVKSQVESPRFGWEKFSSSSVVTVTSVDFDGLLRVQVGGQGNNSGGTEWMLDPAEVEIVEEKPLAVGDWVQVRSSVPVPSHQWGEVTPESVGVVHRVDEEGDLWVAFCFLERLWMCKPSEMERVKPLIPGMKVKIRDSVVSPRLGWGGETRASRGKIVRVDADGKVRVRFRRRENRLWVGDPSDVEVIENQVI